jgi:CheY-like chemotaxis protein
MARVLLFDDEPAVRLTVQQMLQAGGHTVVEGAIGHRLLDDLLSQAYDVVVTDLHMPGLDGWDIATWIAERRPTVPVIAIGGDIDVEHEELRRLFAALLIKPFRRKDLLDV